MVFSCVRPFYRSTLDGYGRDNTVGFGSLFSMREACLGERVYIGRYCSLGFADLGDDVLLADHVTILSGGREHGTPDGSTPGDRESVYRRVCVGEGSWIGSGAVIMADVGRGSTIGAGSVVNKPVPEYSVAVGVPARVIKELARPKGSG